jgi:peptide chain release factor 1
MSLDNLLIRKLQDTEARYVDLNAQLADPDVIADSKKYQKTAKAHSDLGEIVSRYQEYRTLEKSIVDTKALIREAGQDADMKAMAEEELAALEKRRDACSEELKVLLLPKDPNDERNIILEIRAGTGGDEATPFRVRCVSHVFPLRRASALACGDPLLQLDWGRRIQGNHRPHRRQRRLPAASRYESGGAPQSSVFQQRKAAGRDPILLLSPLRVLPKPEDVRSCDQRRRICVSDTFCSSGPGRSIGK